MKIKNALQEITLYQGLDNIDIWITLDFKWNTRTFYFSQN